MLQFGQWIYLIINKLFPKLCESQNCFSYLVFFLYKDLIFDLTFYNSHVSKYTIFFNIYTINDNQYKNFKKFLPN